MVLLATASRSCIKVKDVSWTLFIFSSLNISDRVTWKVKGHRLFHVTKWAPNSELQWTADLLAATSLRLVGWLFGCLTSQQHAGVSQGQICSDNCMCCHSEIEIADQTFHLTQSQYTDTGPTSPAADPMMPGAWQGSHWSANF